MPSHINKLERSRGSRDGMAYVIKILMMVSMGSGVRGELCVSIVVLAPHLSHVGTHIRLLWRILDGENKKDKITEFLS